MATVDPEREFQRLTQFYSSQTDEQLLQIAQDPPSLTDIAERALDDELRRRKLIPLATSSDEVEIREMERSPSLETYPKLFWRKAI